jgi:hypothetical protein
MMRFAHLCRLEDVAKATAALKQGVVELRGQVDRLQVERNQLHPRTPAQERIHVGRRDTRRAREDAGEPLDGASLKEGHRVALALARALLAVEMRKESTFRERDDREAPEAHTQGRKEFLAWPTWHRNDPHESLVGSLVGPPALETLTRLA